MGSVATQAQVEVPSCDRVEPGSFQLHLAALPTLSPPKDVNANIVASNWVESFNKTISNATSAKLSDLFLAESFWRDQLCLSWDFHCLQGPQKIAALLSQFKTGSRLKALSLEKSSESRVPTASIFDSDGKVHTVQAFLNVETDVGSGKGIVRLVQDGGLWKVFTLFTFLEQLKGYEEAVGKNRPMGVQHGEHLSRKNWLDRRNGEESFEDGEEPTVLILGGFLWLLHRYITDFDRCWTSWSHGSSQTEDAGHQFINRRSRRADWRQLAHSISSIGSS